MYNALMRLFISEHILFSFLFVTLNLYVIYKFALDIYNLFIEGNGYENIIQEIKKHVDDENKAELRDCIFKLIQFAIDIIGLIFFVIFMPLVAYIT